MKTIYKTVIGVIIMTIVGITAVACSSTKKGYTDVPDTATAAAKEEFKIENREPKCGEKPVIDAT